MIRCAASLSLVPALLTVAAPADAACASVSIVERGLPLTEGATGVLHIDRGGCDVSDYEISIQTRSPADFDVTVDGTMTEVEVRAVLDPLFETEDELVVSVRRVGQGKADDSATVTIAADNIPGWPVLRLRDNVRGGEFTQRVPVDVIGPAAQNIHYVYDLFDGTAKAGQDYAAVSGGTGVIHAAQPLGTIEVQVHADGIAESEEYFLLRLRWVWGALVSDEQAEIVIDANQT